MTLDNQTLLRKLREAIVEAHAASLSLPVPNRATDEDPIDAVHHVERCLRSAGIMLRALRNNTGGAVERLRSEPCLGRREP